MYLSSNSGLFDAIDQGRSAAKKFYKEWIEEVKRTVPKERLLIYNVDEGWGPLCGFLDVPIPNSAFPYIDDTVEMQKSHRNLKMISYITMFTVPIFVSLLLACYYNYHMQK